MRSLFFGDLPSSCCNNNNNDDPINIWRKIEINFGKKIVFVTSERLNDFFKWASRSLFFFIFVFSIQLTVNMQYNFLPMTGFEPRTSGVGSNRSTNWVTTTAQVNDFYRKPLCQFCHRAIGSMVARLHGYFTSEGVFVRILHKHAWVREKHRGYTPLRSDDPRFQSL